jgi:hypothetical protein
MFIPFENVTKYKSQKKPQTGLFQYPKLKFIYSNTFFFENTIHKTGRLSNRQ